MTAPATTTRARRPRQFPGKKAGMLPDGRKPHISICYVLDWLPRRESNALMPLYLRQHITIGPQAASYMYQISSPGASARWNSTIPCFLGCDRTRHRVSVLPQLREREPTRDIGQNPRPAGAACLVRHDARWLPPRAARDLSSVEPPDVEGISKLPESRWTSPVWGEQEAKAAPPARQLHAPAATAPGRAAAGCGSLSRAVGYRRCGAQGKLLRRTPGSSPTSL